MPRSARSILLLLPTLLLLCTGCEPIRTTRPGAQSIFALIQPPSDAEAKKLATNPYDPNERFRGTSLLVASPTGSQPEFIEIFLHNAEDTDPGVRAVALRGIGAHGSPQHVAIVLARITDEDISVRAEACRALQRLHNPAAIPALAERINPDKELEPRVRREAAIALGQYQDVRALDALTLAVGDEDLGVSEAAHRALRGLTGQDLGTNPKRWREWVATAADPFASGAGYAYPVFRRDRYVWEYIPFMPQPPNEVQSIPAGMSPSIR
jgi:hypothetical protein